ncbi:hypothetical protein [Escherichia coli]|uniref:hypothetical protein n=1 Tax=Escherichia coli TaxID=562 RepID=UPI000F51AA5C|nr:hypothetical protein [Escherichia coli]
MKVNVVICGAIRDRLHLLMILRKIINKRDAGIIEEIILSTWMGEVDAYDDLREILTKTGVCVVENKTILQPSIGNVLQQQRCLESGLVAIKNKSIPVLKVRTDKCFHLLEAFFKHIENTASLQKTKNGVFKYKVTIQMASVSIPFLIADKVFLGYYDDLRMLTLHSDFYERFCLFNKNIGAENRWFSLPFILKYPVFREYIENINFRRVSTILVNKIINNKSSCIPKDVKCFFEIYYSVLFENFNLIGDGDSQYNSWLYLEKNVNAEEHFLIEDRGSRKDLHARNQAMLKAFAGIYFNDEYYQSLNLDSFELFSGESLNEKRMISKITTYNPIDVNFALESTVMAYLPISETAIKFLREHTVQLVNKGVSAQEIYFRCAMKLIDKNKEKYFDDIIILLKNAAKSKHKSSLYLLYCLLKDSDDINLMNYANDCLREAALRGSKEASDVLITLTKELQ